MGGEGRGEEGRGGERRGEEGREGRDGGGEGGTVIISLFAWLLTRRAGHLRS